MTNTPTTTTTEARPLAVWPCAPGAAGRARGNRRAPFEIARRAIETYSRPGDLVLDPLCSDPALPVALEAIRQQRNAAAVIGHHPKDFHDHNQRITAARAGGAAGEAILLRGDPPQLPGLLAEQAGNLLRRRQLGSAVAVHPCGSAELVIVSLPAGLLLGRRQQHSRRWHARFGAADLLGACAAVLRPGGYLVASCDSNSELGDGRDLGSTTVSLCSEQGLRYWQHIVCLLAPIEDGTLKPHPRRRRRHVQPGLPWVVHQNVHVFRKPDASGGRESASAEHGWRR